LFRPVEYISEISEKEIMNIRNDENIYNQVEILVVPQSYKDYCKKLIEETLDNAARFFPT
jgi:HJR/Mrr/RecB family endonuclease